MSNFAFGLLAFAWFGTGIGIVLLAKKGFRSLKAWAEVTVCSRKAHRLNKQREDLMASIIRHGRTTTWSEVCRIIKY